jgi:hypothetical protein
MGGTFRQRSPNPYAVVRRGGIELQFFGLKQYEPAESVSTCYRIFAQCSTLQGGGVGHPRPGGP